VTSGRWIELLYDGSGHISELRDSSGLPGRQVDFTYTNGYLTGATDLRGQTEWYGYVAKNDPDGGAGQVQLLRTVTDKAGNLVLQNTYDDQIAAEYAYRCTSQQDNALRTYGIAYANSTRTEVTNPLGQVTAFVIDTAGRVAEVIDPRNARSSSAYVANPPAKVDRALVDASFAPRQNIGNPALSTDFGWSTEGRGNLTSVLEPSPGSTSSSGASTPRPTGTCRRPTQTPRGGGPGSATSRTTCPRWSPRPSRPGTRPRTPPSPMRTTRTGSS